MEEPIAISSLNQFAFCPRRCALMFVEGIWSDNEHTRKGTFLHKNTDHPGYETDGDAQILRALPLYSHLHGLSGKADIVELRSNEVIPVEYKKGRRRRFDNDDIQLCAQAFCLEEMFGLSAERGYIYHAASHRRREVLLDPELKERTSTTIEAVRKLLTEGTIPPAELKPRCEGCSLRGVCVPELSDEFNRRTLELNGELSVH